MSQPPLTPPPDIEPRVARKRRNRKVFALAAIVAGSLVFLFELREFGKVGPEAWFWLLIAGLAILLGVVELVSRPARDGGNEPDASK